MLYLLASLLSTASCGGAADHEISFSPPEPHTISAFGEWAESTPLLFRIIKVSVEDSIPFGEATEKATKGNHFVVIRLQVMPDQKAQSMVDYAKQVSLVDASGKGCQPDEFRFGATNGINTSAVIIKSGRFVEYSVPFLVPKDFKPLALRCTGDADSEPVHIALRREE